MGNSEAVGTPKASTATNTRAHRACMRREREDGRFYTMGTILARSIATFPPLLYAFRARVDMQGALGKGCYFFGNYTVRFKFTPYLKFPGALVLGAVDFCGVLSRFKLLPPSTKAPYLPRKGANVGTRSREY